MAWETRRGRRYFYTSTRVGRKVKKTYFGSGAEAELAALALETRQEQRRQLAAMLRRSEERCLQVGNALEQLGEALDELVAALLAMSPRTER